MKRKAKADPVPPELAIYVFRRDGGCVVATLVLRGSIAVEKPCRGRLTAAHVRDRAGGRTGKRPPSTARRLASVCEGHHTDDPVVDRADVRPVVDAYLEELEGADVDRSRPWEVIRRVRARSLDSATSERSGGQ